MPQPKFQFEPPLPRRITTGTFLQTIRLVQDGQTVGIARWYAGAGAGEGVIQLLELETTTDIARQGHGTALLEKAVDQAARFLKTRNIKLRRMWMAIEQATQIVGRAFLTNRGFHHVSTMTDLMKKQDILIYIRSFD